jgi:hypothetical protein
MLFTTTGQVNAVNQPTNRLYDRELRLNLDKSVSRTFKKTSVWFGPFVRDNAWVARLLSCS